MIDGSEKRNGWLNFKLQSPRVIERRSKQSKPFLATSSTIQLTDKNPACFLFDFQAIYFFVREDNSNCCLFGVVELIDCKMLASSFTPSSNYIQCH